MNRELEAKARALAEIKGYITNLATCPDGTPVTAGFVPGACRQLSEIERSIRMTEHDLQARPIYHRKRDSIQTRLTIASAAQPPPPSSRSDQRYPLTRALAWPKLGLRPYSAAQTHLGRSSGPNPPRPAPGLIFHAARLSLRWDG